jgi:hypothetical protein
LQPLGSEALLYSADFKHKSSIKVVSRHFYIRSAYLWLLFPAISISLYRLRDR